MTINNPQAFVDGLWNWAVFNGCFGDTRIRMTDIDGLVERRGQFLAIEAKQVGVALHTGQEMVIHALRQTGYFTVLVVWGEPGAPVRVKAYTPSGISPVLPCDLTKLRQLVATWFRQVDQGQKVALSGVLLK
jgi:hypothetical protein